MNKQQSPNPAADNLQNPSQEPNVEFEEVKGEENLVRAKVRRNGMVHQLNVFAIYESDLENEVQPAPTKKDLVFAGGD